jgi:hypothetical protein
MKPYEFKILDLLNNSGLAKLNHKYKNIPTQCYGYDFTGYYIHLLSNMIQPCKAGEMKTLESIDWNSIDVGVYRVKIQISNHDFLPAFMLNATHHYTHYDLKILYQYREELKIEFTLLPADETYPYNALIYTTDKLVRGEVIFSNWAKSIYLLKKEFPSNSLVSHLSKSLWGKLTQYKEIPIDDIENYDADWDISSSAEYWIREMENDSTYLLVKKDDAFKTNLSRLKYFLPSYGRTNLLKYSLLPESNYKYLIRTHTDGMVFCKDMSEFFSNPKKFNPIPEAKTTGYMKWLNAQQGLHCCKKCKITLAWDKEKKTLQSHTC